MQTNSKLFILFNLVCVAAAYVMLASSLFFMPIDFSTKGYLGMGILFLTGSLVTLVKTIRDQTEAERAHEKIERAKTEKLLSDYAEADMETA